MFHCQPCQEGSFKINETGFYARGNEGYIHDVKLTGERITPQSLISQESEIVSRFGLYKVTGAIYSERSINL